MRYRPIGRGGMPLKDELRYPIANVNLRTGCRKQRVYGDVVQVDAEFPRTRPPPMEDVLSLLHRLPDKA
jgi:hypothetical protein